MSYRSEVRISLNELAAFVARSKLKGFAATENKSSLSDGTSVYSNRELPWLYTDTYCGNTVERGTEDVYYDMILVWSLQYRGGVIEEFFPEDRYEDTAKVVSTFLKRALRQLSCEFPTRGPRRFSLNQVEHEGKTYTGEFVYENCVHGDMRRFAGDEKISWDGRCVYYHDYVGGLVRNRYFPVTAV